MENRSRSAYNGHFESTCYHPLLLFNGKRRETKPRIDERGFCLTTDLTSCRFR